MTTRPAFTTIAAAVTTFGLVALVAVTGSAQNSAAIPEKGGPITMVGCFTTGQIGSHEKMVLAKPIVGSIASVPEATCTASGSDQLIKLQDLKQANLGAAALGRWIEIQGRLEGNHRADAVREVHVKSFALVPVVVPAPRVAEVIVQPAPEPPAAVETPAPSTTVAEAAPEPAPVATTGEKELPKTATSLPLFALIGFVSLVAASVLHLFTRRDIESA